MKSFGQVRVEQSIDSVEIRVGEQAQLKLNVTIAKGNSLQWPLLKERQYLVPGLEIVQLEPADTIHEDGEQLTIEKKYTLTAFEEHLFSIPALNKDTYCQAYSTSSKGIICYWSD